eukprot:TRINITY_DN71613_c0_g1_i1.p1 TRINITY_DN71613_c0_g1~~TRINITY_DN71613_c0_g1_i1.p1  ORF type:complete len:795 (-),score=109.90 TRINITY_DN71613_c0_g1_i1:49-2433(-)
MALHLLSLVIAAPLLLHAEPSVPTVRLHKHANAPIRKVVDDLSLVQVRATSHGSRKHASEPGRDTDGTGQVSSVALTTVSDFYESNRQGDDDIAPYRVCLVTNAFEGPTASGGIAQAALALATTLAGHQKEDGSRKFEVTVLYTAPPPYRVIGSSGPYDGSGWRDNFKKLGITFVPLPKKNKEYCCVAEPIERSYRVWEWLRQKDGAFDVVAYHDWMGVGFFAALGKRLGLALQNTQLLAHCYGSSRWLDEHELRAPANIHTLGRYYIEERSVEWAEHRVSPSRFYLQWLQESKHLNLGNGSNFVALDVINPQPSAIQSQQVQHSKNLLFFGRLEERKGLLVFLDALDKLKSSRQSIGADKITFLGADAKVGGRSSRDMILERARNGGWDSKVQIISDYDNKQTMDFLSSSDSIVVIPSMAENLPYVVLEAASMGLPIIATSVGGIPEILQATQNAGHTNLAPGDSAALTSALATALDSGITPPQLDVDLHSTSTDMVNLFTALGAKAQRASLLMTEEQQQESLPHFMVGVSTYNRPAQLLEAIESFSKQDYPKEKLTIVIMDDASDAEGAQEAFDAVDKLLKDTGIRHEIVRKEAHDYVASRRNEMLSIGKDMKADYVCLFDDDDVAEPAMLSTYAKAIANSDPDMITDLSNNYELSKDGQKHFKHVSLAVGNAFSYNFFANNYGKANFCVRPEKALAFGGHQVGPNSDSPLVDWGFFTRASLAGLKIELVPLPLYRYTMGSEHSILATSTKSRIYKGHRKIVDDMLAELPENLRDMVLFAKYNSAYPQVGRE